MIAMTGYGRGEASNGALSISIEIRSTTHRFRDIQIRVPKGYLSLEPRIRSRVGKLVIRGRVEIFVHRHSLDSTHNITADPTLAERYLKAMKLIAKRVQKEEESIRFEDLIQQPGVLHIQENLPDANAEWVLIDTALQAALDHLQMHRTQQGIERKKKLEVLIASLQMKRAEIEENNDHIHAFLFEKLEGRLKRLLGSHLPPRRLSQEAAILVDKADVSQELIKIRTSCDQLRGALEKTESVGKKLDFILQDLGRELNTIGAKIVDHRISHTIIEAKELLERIREEANDLE